MTAMEKQTFIKRQTGFTLVELMVAMVIGLLITLVVMNAYLTAVGTQRAQTDLTRLQESARFAFDVISKEVRRAGYRDLEKRPSDYFCATGTQGSPVTGGNDANSLTIGGTSVSNFIPQSDVITSTYFGQDNAAGTAADGAIQDCLGNAVRNANLVADTLFIATDSSTNEPTLYCRTTNPDAGTTTMLPLVTGVETLQMLYGEDTDQDGAVNRYVPYSGLTSTDKINSVMVSMVIRTPDAVATDRNAKIWNLFGGDYAPGNSAPAGDASSVFTSPADGRLRILFSSVIAVRNYSYCK